jgi:hypothetical protein
MKKLLTLTDADCGVKCEVYIVRPEIVPNSKPTDLSADWPTNDKVTDTDWHSVIAKQAVLSHLLKKKKKFLC